MAANVNNYVSAGNAAVRKAVQARKALADNKARLDEIGMEAVEQAARNAANTAKNNSQTAQQVIDAKRYIKETEIKIETDKAVAESKKTARKAGLLGAGVGMIAVGKARMDKKEEPNELLGLLKNRKTNLDSQISEKETAIQEAQKAVDSYGTDGMGTQPTDTTKPAFETAAVPQGDISTASSSTPSSPSNGNQASADPTFKSIVSMAEKSGAAYPQLVAAQWAVESGWGKTPSGKNNYFGIKATAGESGTTKQTWEVYGGKEVTTDAKFKNFDTPQAGVDELVDRWHKDYKGYSGVNRGGTAAEAADLLVQEGYATDPNYAAKLKKIMADQGY